ncbi:DUF397 domain-containing protein [Streptomyces acidicola]|uniref:DUF397 domain-containing protein n=1 Tax=Streptomyces acidicola TaxID=2596892 RepID=UPI00382A42C7
MAVRDSKAPARSTLSFSAGAFATFVGALKSARSTVGDFANVPLNELPLAAALTSYKKLSRMESGSGRPERSPAAGT